MGLLKKEDQDDTVKVQERTKTIFKIKNREVK